MYKLNDFYAILEKHAPIRLSESCIEKGMYDNSGIIVKQSENCKSALFTLDLSTEAVKKAKRLKCDVIVTHHPAIYAPIKCLSFEGDTGALLEAIASKISVISLHLNLDMAKNGIDYCLSTALGAKEFKILDDFGDGEGYGREFSINAKTFAEIKALAKKNLKTNRVFTYGNLKEKVNAVASFCGAGSGDAVKLLGALRADLIVTSDVPHHAIKAIVEAGKKLMILPHYSAENYGFNEYYAQIAKELNGNMQTYYFEDKRFM